MKYAVDTHSHTLVSGHAYNTMSEMAKAARDAGLEALAITEHGPAMEGSCQEIYFRNYKAVDHMAYGIELLLGCEMNILDYEGRVDLSKRAQAQLDIGLASIHDLCYTIGSREENTRAYCLALENPYVDIIGHPDDGRVPVDFEQLVRCARDNGKILELNNASLNPLNPRQNGYENMKLMLGYCERYGVPVALGSDSHFFTQVGHFEGVQAIVDEVRFPQELIVNTSLGKLKKHLHKFQ